MKILLMADSHREKDLVSKIVADNISNVDMVIHLGDGIEEFVEVMDDYSGIPYYYVVGNHERNNFRWNHYDQTTITVEGHSISVDFRVIDSRNDFTNDELNETGNPAAPVINTHTDEKQASINSREYLEEEYLQKYGKRFRTEEHDEIIKLKRQIVDLAKDTSLDEFEYIDAEYKNESLEEKIAELEEKIIDKLQKELLI